MNHYDIEDFFGIILGMTFGLFLIFFSIFGSYYLTEKISHTLFPFCEVRK
jgi:hypothetical protein